MAIDNMVILGLGSNLGDKLANLRQALSAIEKLNDIQIKQISPVYISDALLPENAPPEWDKPYLNFAIRCETNLSPEDLLNQLKNIEWSIGRKPEVRHWGPRVIDIDILAWGNQIINTEKLTVPHVNLQERPFALWPLADVAPFWTYPLAGANEGKTAAQMIEIWGSRFSGDAPFHTRQINQRVENPQLVGILNITSDSFSDGGLFYQEEHAFEQFIQLVESGAEVIDIGAESTSPTANPLNPETEWQRLEPVLTMIKETNLFLQPKISVDTRHALTAKKALQYYDVDWINDVSGLDLVEMRDVVLQAKKDCVVMHHMSIPERRDNVIARNQDPVKIVYEWGEKRIGELEKLGISREKIIFDPGIGFGKLAEQSLALLQKVEVFAGLGCRVLIGHSRKTFMSMLSGMAFKDRDVETMAMMVGMRKKNVTYFRVHNVDMCARGLRAAAALIDHVT